MAAKPATAQVGAKDLTRYSLEDLLSLEATSVAKKRQRISEAAAAVFVITQDDIRRSGARTVPDLLRMVPGVEVGLIDGNSTAVSMRGFNTRFANSVLVLVDGRAIYVSAVSGVLWDQLLIPLNAIERIEVVRGPGGTVWGANAVNGIINIITKNTAQLRGNSANLRLGTDGQDFTLQSGGGGEDLGYRLTAAGRQQRTFTRLISGRKAPLTSRGMQFGALVDAAPNAEEAIAFKAIVAVGDFGPHIKESATTALATGRYNDVDFIGRWSRRLNDTADIMVQSFVDRVRREEGGISVAETVLDLEINAHATSGFNDTVAGINYRLTKNRLESNAAGLGFLTDGSKINFISGFIQNEYWIVPDRLRLTVGTKIEHSSIAGLNAQPSVRLLGRIGTVSVWSAVSRAVRTPALLERNGTFATTAGPVGQRFYSPVTVKVTAAGSPALRTAKLDSFEAGIRLNVGDWITVDAAVYHNRYKGLVGFAPIAAQLALANGVPTVAADYQIVNNTSARNDGFELAATWKPISGVKVDGSYSYIRNNYHIWHVTDIAGITGALSQYGYSLPILPQPGLVTTPASQYGIRMHWDASPTVEIDGWIRHVDKLRLVDVDAYNTVDLRAAIQVGGTTTLTVIGRNLIGKNRLDFRESLISAAPAIITRQIALEIRLRM